MSNLQKACRFFTLADVKTGIFKRLADTTLPAKPCRIEACVTIRPDPHEANEMTSRRAPLQTALLTLPLLSFTRAWAGLPAEREAVLADVARVIGDWAQAKA